MITTIYLCPDCGYKTTRKPKVRIEKLSRSWAVNDLAHSWICRQCGSDEVVRRLESCEELDCNET